MTLTCPVTGTFVNWYKDGRELTETEYIRISEEKLRIKNVTHEDQGFYSCKPIDGFGAGPSENNFTLMVYSKYCNEDVWIIKGYGLDIL